MKVKIDLDRSTGNFWIDNGIVVLNEIFGEGEYEVEYVLKTLIDKLVEKTGNVGEYYDEKEGKIKEYERKNWKYPANLFIKSTPRADKIKIEGVEHFLYPPEFTLKLDFSRSRDTCDVCGVNDVVTSAKMWMFPFSVEPSKFSNFYSGLKRGTKLCPRCALAGLAGYLGWLWKAQGRDKLHIFIFYSDLNTMKDLRENVFKTLEYSEETKGGNIPVEFYGPYIHETTFGLLLRLFRELSSRERIISPEAEQLLKEIFEYEVSKPITLFSISGSPGKAFNMDTIYEFSEFKTLYKLYKSWISLFQDSEGIKPHQIIVGIFNQFQKKEGRNWNTMWRDRISWAILELRDPSGSIEDFLFDARVKDEKPYPLLWGTLDIFHNYWKEVIEMDEKLLNVLRGFGHSLGAKARESNEMGLLFSLRNAKNPDDFYKVLNDVQFRLNLTVPEDILQIEKGEKIKGSPWLRVKTILSIYAMNSYLRGKNKEEE